MVFFGKKRTNSERLLEENGWLWAVNSEWGPDTPIDCRELTDFVLRRSHVEPIWLFVYCPNRRRHIVYKLDLAGMALKEKLLLHDHYELISLVSFDNGQSGCYTIWRAPKDTTILQMCRRLSNPSPVGSLMT